MTIRQYHDMAHGDEQLYELSRGMPSGYEPPEYPSGLQFAISKADMEKAGGEGGAPGESMRFSAMGVVTSVFRGIENCRVELEITQFAGEDGKFADLERPASICLCGPDLEKMDMEADCECGDMLHIIGTVRLENTHENAEWGVDHCTLQIVEMAVEDESDEARKG